MNRRLPLEVDLDSSPCCQADLAGWRVVSDYPTERCRSCGSAYVNPRPGLEALKEHYAAGGHGQRTHSTIEEVLEAEKRYPNSTVDARRILSVVSDLAPGRRLLDVGSGYGFYAREASDRGFEVDALELSGFERRCTHQIAGVQPEAVTFEEFETEPDSYDVILMSQILEHVVDPVEWIEKAGRFVAPGGVLALALPNFDSFLRRLLGAGDPLVHPPDHLNYFNDRGLARLLSRQSFAVSALTTISRIPGRALTDRVPVPHLVEGPLEKLLQSVQRPILWPLDALNLGMFLNVYAGKEVDA